MQRCLKTVFGLFQKSPGIVAGCLWGSIVVSGQYVIRAKTDNRRLQIAMQRDNIVPQ
jgi:hypothetical protein